MEPLPTLPIGEGLEDLKRLSSAYSFYFFTFNALWVRGMGKMPIPPTFYFFTLLLLKASFTFNS